MTAPLRLGILLSGSGRTLQNLIDRIADGRLHCAVACVISDRTGVKGLERAQRNGLPSYVEKDSERIFATLRQHAVDLVCLCGYLRLLRIEDDFEGRVLNIHPALLPKFGGKGFYGERVHRAVLEAGDTESGCTVHLCNNDYDQGRILLQRPVAVSPDDDVDSLAARVFAAECDAYPAAIELWLEESR